MYSEGASSVAVIDRQRPIWLVCLLTFLTGGVYYLWWFGASWAELKRERHDPNMSPLWHALTQLVPIYSWFRIHAHYRVLNELLQQQRASHSIEPGLMVVVGVVADVASLLSMAFAELRESDRVANLASDVAGLLSMAFAEPLPSLIGPLSLAALIFRVAYGQAALNAYYAAKHGRLAVKRVTAGEWVALGVIALAWLLSIVLVVLIASLAASSDWWSLSAPSSPATTYQAPSYPSYPPPSGSQAAPLVASTVPPSAAVSFSTVLFRDDFSNVSSGWAAACDPPDLWQGGYASGEFRVVKLAGTGVAPGPCHPRRFRDFQVEVDAALVPPTAGAYAWIEVRQQAQHAGDRSRAASYAFSVQPDARVYTLSRLHYGTRTVLAERAGVSEIRPSSAINRIGVRAVGPELTLLVNGVAVDRVTDATFAEGMLAFGVGHILDHAAEGRFRNLVVTSVR